jgi:hypothetical protein
MQSETEKGPGVLEAMEEISFVNDVFDQVSEPLFSAEHLSMTAKGWDLSRKQGKVLLGHLGGQGVTRDVELSSAG